MTVSARTSLKIVVLECPYDTWDDPFTREMYAKMISLKLKGYSSGYPYGILPVGGDDLVSTHLMICEERAGGLEPLLGYKSITQSRAAIHQLIFPALSIAMNAPSPEHTQALEALKEQCGSQKWNLRYDSAYTILPGLRDDRELIGDLKILMTGMHTLFHQEYESKESLLVGVLKFKTDHYFAKWGYQPVRLGEKELPPLPHFGLFRELVSMMALKDFTDHARACADETRSLWDQRITAQAKPGAPVGIAA